MSNRRYPAWQNGSWLALTELFYLVLSLAQNGVTLAKAVGLGSFIPPFSYVSEWNLSFGSLTPGIQDLVVLADDTVG